MNDPQFDSARARLERALRYRQEMGSIARREFKEHPPIEWIRNERDAAILCIKAAKPVPLDIALVFSDWLHAVRTALDNAYYTLAIVETGQDPPTNHGRRQFPLVADPNKFGGNRLSGFCDEARSIIEDFQPYKMRGGKTGSALWWLHELARMDRHRSEHFFQWRIVDLEITFRGPYFAGSGTVCSQQAAFLETGQDLELARGLKSPFQSVDDHPGSHVDIDYRVELDIRDWYERCFSTYRWRFDHRLQSFESEVAALISRFDEHCQTFH
ncbi:hypothetical protein [Corynebacterium pygosceleis]|uniref:hypothetical protein n=1 Tax=Corynebacterium pygosceleis TaxID=2800406 RepID=UPI00190858DF|nr:hypothetical protein [Corynebacterium pygosceleis]MCL0120654.1 hypothetical protein [Corynebacterium pygosceleis]